MRGLVNMVASRVWITISISLFFGFTLLEYQISNLQSNGVHSNLEKDIARVVNSESGRVMDDELTVVVYNRVPKTGSTTFAHLVYDSSKRNGIYVARISTTKDSHIMSLQDQYKFVQNITHWRQFRPAFFHGHIFYVDFKRFGSPVAPIYINIIRDPLDRLVSFYYFVRHGDDLRKDRRHSRHGDETTFDECVKKGRKNSDCAINKLWLQIPFFCGQSAECWTVGSDWALQEAKKNLANNYMLVGLTEQMEDFVLVLEAVLPRMFRGLTDMLRSESKNHIRNTLHKEPPSKETIDKFHSSKIWRMEMELYNFAKEQFEFIKQQSTIKGSDGVLKPAPKRFRYQKVHGPNGRIII